jgi:hypothetical protein
MLARSYAFAVLVLAGSSTGLASCAAHDDATSSDEADWVIRPNGTADVATVTLQVPEGFSFDVGSNAFGPWGFWRANAGRFRFTLDATPLVAGTAVRVRAGQQAFLAHFDVEDRDAPGGFREVTQNFLGYVDPRPAFDTVVTFGTVRIANIPIDTVNRNPEGVPTYLKAQANVYAATARIRPFVDRGPGSLGGFYTRPGYRANGSQYREYLWGFSDTDVPFGAGSYRLQYETNDPLKSFSVALGQRTDVDGRIETPPVFTVRSHRVDPRTMPDAVTEWTGVVHVGCGVDHDFELREHLPSESGMVTDDGRLTLFVPAGGSACSATLAPLRTSESFRAPPGRLPRSADPPHRGRRRAPHGRRPAGQDQRHLHHPARSERRVERGPQVRLLHDPRDVPLPDGHRDRRPLRTLPRRRRLPEHGGRRPDDRIHLRSVIERCGARRRRPCFEARR